jgi:hypothetical protein
MNVAKDNNPATAIDYNKQRGVNYSANEHLIPEKIFTSPANPGQAVSAVKALAVASAQGQKIFTLTAQNIATMLPQLTISPDVQMEIQNAVAAGKEATVSQGNVTVGGWSGVGYIISDPVTGAGAYKVSGSANGGYLYLLANAAGTVAQLAVLGFIVGIVSGTAFIGVWFVAAAILFASMISWLAYLYDERATDGRYSLSEAIISMAGALPHLGTTYGPLVYLIEIMIGLRGS